MLLPDVVVQIKDGALGLLPPATDQVQVKIGVSSQGTKNQLYAFSDTDAVIEALGHGPLVEALATTLTLSGGPVYAIRGEASTAGTVSAVDEERVGASDGTLAVTGAPNDSYDAIVRITRSGSVAGNDAAFQYSLDGGDTFSPEIALVASYLVPGTGLTLGFTDAAANPTFEEGDEFTFTATAPAMTLADLTAAIDVALADVREWAWLHVVGAATPAIAAGVATKMQEAQEAHRYVFAVLEARDVNQDDDTGSVATWRSNIVDEWASFADVRVAVAAGRQELVSPITGRIHRRSDAWAYTGRLAAIGVATHPGQVIDGPVQGIVSLVHDEQVTPSLDQEGFTTFRTIIGRTGFYVTQGRMKAPESSDFTHVETRRTVDKACRIARNGLLRFLNESVRVDGSGNILERDARAIEAYIDGQLQAGLISPGEASGARISVKRNANILSTRELRVTVRIRPLAYLSFITVELGLENPSLIAS